MTINMNFTVKNKIMKIKNLFYSQPSYLIRTAIEAEILFAVCVIEKQALTGGKSLACEDKCSKKIGAKSAVLHFVFFMIIINKMQQSAKRKLLLNKNSLSEVFPLTVGSGKTMTFENRRGKYKELGKKVPQAYRVYVEDTFLPCDAVIARIFSKEMTHTDNHGDNEEQKAKRYYYHSDHLGSAQFVTDWHGRQYEHIEYTPYGELWIEEVAAGLDKLPFRFTGKELDEETGLYYYGARYLDPKYSRWLSGDPALSDYIPQAPVNDEAKKHNENLPGMGGIYNTVNLHVYHYAGNNPIKYVDPDGRKTVQNYRLTNHKNFVSDLFGVRILLHYLFGLGRELVLSNKRWGNYMRNNRLLTEQINTALLHEAGQKDLFEGDVHEFKIKIHAEIENGESIIGYQYLHGSNADVGDLEIFGTMLKDVDGNVHIQYTAQWNDIIDPNYKYFSDKKKAKLAKILSFGLARDYIIRIKWENSLIVKKTILTGDN